MSLCSLSVILGHLRKTMHKKTVGNHKVSENVESNRHLIYHVFLINLNSFLLNSHIFPGMTLKPHVDVLTRPGSPPSSSFTSDDFMPCKRTNKFVVKWKISRM